MERNMGRMIIHTDSIIRRVKRAIMTTQGIIMMSIRAMGMRSMNASMIMAAMNAIVMDMIIRMTD
ncbi:MAG: hypothetical protein IKD50_13260 [Clostridia bacterium]|nr:hypothetical protein [Clostridia bacterium]